MLHLVHRVYVVHCLPALGFHRASCVLVSHPLRPIARWLMSACQKLPAFVGRVWRGIKVPHKEMMYEAPPRCRTASAYKLLEAA